MRIAIATVQVPFVWGGAEYHAQNLKNALEKAGHTAEIVTVPFKWYPPEKITEQILACRLLDLTESCGNKIDLLIGLKFPAYFIRHPNKVLWILHQYRQAYELWGTRFGDLHLSPFGPSVRNAIINADNLYLNEAKKVFANSQNVSMRLSRYNNISAIPLYHPCPGANKFYAGEYENYILYPSRLTEIKRQDLAIEAMQYVKTPIRLLLVGQPDNPNYLKHLKVLIDKYNLGNKVKILGSVSEEEKIKLYADCRGVLFIPYDEDYGYITLEAFYSSKAVITCKDSGGPLEFVEDAKTGFLCETNPKEIAKAIDALSDTEHLAREMGNNARSKIMDLNISWKRVVRELTGE